MAIHKVENRFLISSRGVWLPGAYADEKVAMAAFKVSYETLQKLQDAANARSAEGRGVGHITQDDLAATRSN